MGRMVPAAGLLAAGLLLAGCGDALETKAEAERLSAQARAASAPKEEYRMKLKAIEPDGTTTVVDTDKARQVWQCEKDFDGRNWINRSPGDQWVRETLYLSARGRYYIVTDSAWQGALPGARFVDEATAAAWLRLNEHDLPEDLKPHDPTE